jgi:O-antigen ligase
VPDTAIPTSTLPMGTRGADNAATALKWCLVAILAVAPLPLASARPLAWSMLALATAVLVCLAMGCEFVDRTPTAIFAPLRLPIALAALVGVWIGFQSLHLDLHDVPSEVWASATRALDRAVIPSISLDRAASLERSLRLLTYVSVFLAAWRVARRSEDASTLLRGIAFIGVAYSLYGMVIYFSGNQTILWYSKWAYKLDLTGTFVNRNSFATFAGLSMMAGLALMAQVQIKRIDGRSLRTFGQSSIEAVLWHGRWVTAALVIVGSALLLTHSRGGTMAALIGGGVLVASAASAPSLRAPWRYAFAALGALAAIAVFAVNGAGVVTRVASAANDVDFRFDIDSGTWQAIADNFLTGTGLGTFQYVYAPYQPPSVGLFVDLAHNDYLENMLELGVPAAAVFYASLLLLVWRCLQGVFRRRRDAVFACASLGASALVGSHAAVDFSMQMPAVAITYATILGVGVAQSASSRDRSGSSGSP